ncbi:MULTISPECIES: hypothetical protein [Sphingobacterium]|uniref:hypothetical protein n=1 Tax=Sphingobacterium TaxID=28453 RepID=UPI00162AAFA3|nr:MULTISPECIES: hypothetical protein [Sphingobacterium]
MSTKPTIDFLTRVKEMLKKIETLLKEGANLEPESRFIRRLFYLFEIVTIFAMFSCFFFYLNVVFRAE